MNYKSTFLIDQNMVGLDCPVYFIADIAANHDGDIVRAKELIWLAKECGAHAAKFQHFSAHSIVSDYGFKSLKCVSTHQTNWNKSVYEVYKDASVDLEWTSSLKETCHKAGITFFTSPYSIDIVDFIDSYVPAYKIGSGDITFIEIIEAIAKKNKPYIIATGAATFDDVYRAVNSVVSINNSISLLQCNTNYTGSLENLKYVQLSVLKSYKEAFPGMILGLSDHTPGHTTVLGAISLGAKIIEKHFTDNISREGPDHAFSMDPKSWQLMMNCSRELESALGNGIKRIEENELESMIVQRRSIRARNDMSAGSKIIKADIEFLRPCPNDAMPPYLASTIIDKRLKRNVRRGDYFRICDFE